MPTKWSNQTEYFELAEHSIPNKNFDFILVVQQLTRESGVLELVLHIARNLGRAMHIRDLSQTSFPIDMALNTEIMWPITLTANMSHTHILGIVSFPVNARIFAVPTLAPCSR
jgi:hypothetical protein